MIKFTVDTKDGKLVGLGIAEANVRRLKKGQPIKVDLQEIGLGEGSIGIFYAKTERELLDMLSPYIGPDTKLK